MCMDPAKHFRLSGHSQKGIRRESEAEFCSDTAPAGEPGRPVLLCVGNDEALLSYRCKVLNLAGFEGVAATPRPEPTNKFTSLSGLNVVAMAAACHTLTAKQRIHLASEIREACPHVPLLA